jgi:hypothetical protein
MDLMGIIVWLAVLVSLGLFIWMLVKSLKGWGALHTTLLTLLFLEVWCFLFFTAGVASRRNGFVKAYEKLKAVVEKREVELDRARMGDKIDPKTDYSSFIPLTNELNRLLVERGRVWRGATVTGIGQNEASLQLGFGGMVAGNPAAPAVVDPAAAPAAAAPVAAPAVTDAGSRHNRSSTYSERLQIHAA